MQQVDQAGPAQPRPFQFDSTTDAVKDQNQRAIQAARKGGTRNSSQTGQTPGEADSTMPPNPLVAVACGAGAATATQILDPADGLEFGGGSFKPVGNSLGVSCTPEVPNHSLPLSNQSPAQAWTHDPVLRSMNELQPPFVPGSSSLLSAARGDDGESQLRVSCGESLLEKPTALKPNGAEASRSEAADSTFSHLPMERGARAAVGIPSFHSAQTANSGSQTVFVEQNPAYPTDGDSDAASPVSIQEDGHPSRRLDLSPPTSASAESASQIAVLTQQLFSIANKASDDVSRVRPSTSSKARQPIHGTEENEDTSHANLLSATAHEKSDGELPPGSANLAEAAGLTGRRMANVEVRANVAEVVPTTVATGETQRGSQHDAAANADTSAKPPSLGQSSPEDGTSNPLADSSLTGGVIHTARLVESMKESAINLSVRSVDFGNVDIHTAMEHGRLSAQISLERNDLGNALSRTIPGLQSKLSQEHGIQATIEVQQQTSSFSANSGQSQNHTPRPQRNTAEGPAQNVPDSLVLAVPVIADGRIDIRI